MSHRLPVASMCKRYLLLTFSIFLIGIVQASIAATQELKAASDSPYARLADVTITVDPDQIFQRIDGFGAFGSQTVPWDRKHPTFTSQFINNTLRNLGLTISRTYVPTSLEINNDNQRSGTGQKEQDDQFTIALDANGIAYADPGTLDLSGFNLDRFPVSGSKYAEHRPLIYETEFLTSLAVTASELDTPLKIIASIWSPPWWMKYIPAYFGQDTYWNRMSDGIQGDLPRMYEEFAEYCVAYVKLIERETRPPGGKVGDGIHLYALSPQNEPAFGQRYASAVYSPTQYKAMLNVVGRRFAREREHWLVTIDTVSPTYKPPGQRADLDFFPAVKLFGPEDVSDFTRIHRYLNPLLTDQETRKYLDIIAVHGYQDDGVTAGGNTRLWQDTYRIARRYNKPLWQTETSGYGPSWSGNKEGYSAIKLAEDMHKALVHGNVNAWMYWALSDKGASRFGLTAHGFPVSTYHVSTHFYRFIKPGSVRLGATSSDKKLLVSAFYHPSNGNLTIVLVNTDKKPRNAILNLADRTEIPVDVFQKYVSTKVKKVGREEITSPTLLTIEPFSITTLYAPNYALVLDLQRMDFKTHPQDATVTVGQPAEFEAFPFGPYPWRFDFQWEMKKSEQSKWNKVGENIPYLKLNNVQIDDNKSKIRLRLIGQNESETTVVSPEANLTVISFEGLEVPRARGGQTWSEKKNIDNPVYGNIKDITHNGTVQLAWDETFLYVKVSATELTPTGSTGKPWSGDGMELYLDTLNSKSTTYGPEHYQLFIGHTGSENIFSVQGFYSSQIDMSSVRGEAKATPTDWQITAEIPWSELGVDARPGMHLGFDIHLVDGKANAKRRISKLALYATQDDAWSNPSSFGTIRLAPK